MKDRFRYFKEKHIVSLILIALIILNVLMVVIGGFVLSLLPDNKGLSIVDAFWKSGQLLLDPGGFMANKLSAITTIVTCLIVLFGMIITSGGFIGYVTNYITTKIDDSSNGKSDVSYDNCWLILNWNDRALMVLKDYLKSGRAEKNPYWVILADHDKKELEDYIVRELKSYKKTHYLEGKLPKVIVRQGKTYQKSGLEKVNCQYARRIFIFSPDDENPDLSVLKTFLCLNEYILHMRECVDVAKGNVQENDDEKVRMSVVVEVANDQIAKEINRYKLESTQYTKYVTHAISTDVILGKMYAQMAIYPSTCKFFREITSIAGAVLNDYEFVDDDERDFDEDLKKLVAAVPLLDEKDEKHHRRLYLSSEEYLFQYEFENVEFSDSDIKYETDVCFNDNKIVTYSINNKMCYFLNSIKAHNETYPKARCKVQIVVPKHLQVEAERIYSEADYSDVLLGEGPVVIPDAFCVQRLLEELENNLHSFIIFSEDSANDFDVFKLWISLKNSMSKEQQSINSKVILEMSGIDNSEIFFESFDTQMVVSNEYISKLMIQATRDGELQSHILDMITCVTDKDMQSRISLFKDDCDVVSVSAKKFFGNIEHHKYRNKQDFIYNVYKETKGAAIPIALCRPGYADVLMLTDLTYDLEKEFIYDRKKTFEEFVDVENPEEYLYSGIFGEDDVIFVKFDK